MRRTLTAFGALVALAVTLTAVAAADPVAAKQRVAIRNQGSEGFALSPLTAGALKFDSGTASFCCWSSHYVIRNGQKVEVTTGPELTLVGKRGTIVASNRMEFLEVADGFQLFTGTWKVVRGTGAYAGLTGGGGVAGVALPNGQSKWRREGFLTPK